jgi:lysophospholipase L1-like esterase
MDDIDDFVRDKTISDELNKNGNTNLISNSGFPEQIFAIGDSHSILFHKSLKVKHFWFGMSGLPVTIYTLDQQLNLYNVGNIVSNNKEKINIKPNDYVMFFYGWNDIQKNVFLYAERDWQNEIYRLVKKYICLLVYYKIAFNINPIACCIYPAYKVEPNEKTDTIHGSNNERICYTLEYNKLLRNECQNNNIKLYDIYDLIVDKEGHIQRNYMSENDKTHLDHTNKILRNLIDDYIVNLIN